jgi:hypothetical protein
MKLRIVEKDFKVGQWVIYRKGSKLGEEQMGMVKSWNDKFIFVVFQCDGEWDRYFDYTAQACNPEDLTIVPEGTFKSYPVK